MDETLCLTAYEPFDFWNRPHLCDEPASDQTAPLLQLFSFTTFSIFLEWAKVPKRRSKSSSERKLSSLSRMGAPWEGRCFASIDCKLAVSFWSSIRFSQCWLYFRKNILLKDCTEERTVCNLDYGLGPPIVTQKVSRSLPQAMVPGSAIEKVEIDRDVFQERIGVSLWKTTERKYQIVMADILAVSS
jgi:hypothetical protein